MRYEIERTVQPLFTLQSHSLGISSVKCTHGSHAKLVSTSLDGTCCLFDLHSGQELCTFKLYTSIHSVVTSANEHTIFLGTANGRIYEVQLYPFSPAYLEAPSQPISAVLSVTRAMNNVKSVSVEDKNENEQQQQQHDGNACAVYKGHANVVCSLDLSEDGQTLFSASKDGSFKVWDTASKQQLFSFTKHVGGLFFAIC